MTTGAMAGGLFLLGFMYASANSLPAPDDPVSDLGSEDDTVMCSYLSYGVRNYVCGKPPMEDVKKKCEEKGSKEHGEKITCACTDDPNYIRDTCD